MACDNKTRLYLLISRNLPTFKAPKLSAPLPKDLLLCSPGTTPLRLFNLSLAVSLQDYCPHTTAADHEGSRDTNKTKLELAPKFMIGRGKN